jgi:hypothetical protein
MATSFTSFGQSISVLGPNIGFPGTISRQGERVVTAREFVPFNVANNLNFGDPAVSIPNQQGGFWTSVADFIAASQANIGLLATQWAGMAVREVKTSLVYPAGQTPGILQVGFYTNKQMAEVLERGSGTVLLTVGSPNQGAQIYTRVVLNTANVPAGFIGDYETNPAATDLFNTTATAAAIGTALTLASAANTKNGQLVTGLGIAPGTFIASGGGTVNAVLNQPVQQVIAAGTPVTVSNLFALPSVVARTGFVDANSMLEITILRRQAA